MTVRGSRAPNTSLRLLAVVVVIGAAVGFAFAGCGTSSGGAGMDASSGSPDATADAAGDDASTSAAPLRVLFVGNSYTYVNDLPSVVHALGAATPGVAVNVDSVTEGGATLESLWTAGNAPARIASRGFDAVVLQGNSLEAFGTAEFFYPYARQFADAVRDAGARTIWYETWAPRADDSASFFANWRTTPDFMTRSIDHAYRKAGASGGTVARAGVAWQLALAEEAGITLYADDGSHPSPAGTLLTACTIFFALTGKEAVLPEPVPFGIDRPTATALCALAPRVLCGPGGCGCENAAQVTTTYSALHALTPACDGSTERRGLDCSAAMNAACSTPPCVSAGFGIGPVSSTGDAVDLTCVAGTTLNTTFAALSALDASCDGTTERYGADCAAAVDRACAATGALAGFGPTSAMGNEVTATCVSPANALREHLEFNELAAYDGNCDGVAQAWGADCDIAVDSFCRQHGFAGGFGPVSIAAAVPVTDAGPHGGGVDFVCVAW